MQAMLNLVFFSLFSYINYMINQHICHVITPLRHCHTVLRHCHTEVDFAPEPPLSHVTLNSTLASGPYTPEGIRKPRKEKYAKKKHLYYKWHNKSVQLRQGALCSESKIN